VRGPWRGRELDVDSLITKLGVQTLKGMRIGDSAFSREGKTHFLKFSVETSPSLFWTENPTQFPGTIC
jgi:hypothetical protein